MHWGKCDASLPAVSQPAQPCLQSRGAHAAGAAAAGEPAGRWDPGLATLVLMVICFKMHIVVVSGRGNGDLR